MIRWCLIMRDTVFVPSFGNRPRNLVGREEIISKFEASLQSAPGSRERAMLMLGQRGSGKTVLLLEFAEIARKQGCIVASPTVVSKEMPTRILEKLRSEGEDYLPGTKAQFSGGSVSAFGFGGGFDLKLEDQEPKSFAWNLSQICSALNKNGKPVLILIDEVQANQEELRQLIVAYQEMVGEGMDIFMVLAGLPTSISSVLNDHVLTFLNRAVKIHLPPLRTGDIEFYYQKAFTDLNIRLDDVQISAAAKETDGSPYLMQLIGHYIVLSAEERSCVTEAQFSSALQRAKEDFMNDICGTALAPLSDKDIAFLAAMAMDGETTEISAVISRLNCTSSLAQTYKRRLIQSGIIRQPRRGAVQFAVPYLRDYLYKNYAE